MLTTLGTRFDTHRVPGDKGKRDKIVLKMSVASAYADIVHTEGLADGFESTMSRKDTKHTAKVMAQIATL